MYIYYIYIIYIHIYTYIYIYIYIYMYVYCSICIICIYVYATKQKYRHLVLSEPPVKCSIRIESNFKIWNQNQLYAQKQQQVLKLEHKENPFLAQIVQKWILGLEFLKSKSGFGNSSSKIPCVAIFRRNG